MGLNTDSSPFQSSPLEGAGATSPRVFWQKRGFETENTYGGFPTSPSPTRRSSIERLQKASRVKNSNILALEQKQEYDPTRIPQIERPLAKVQGNAFGGTGLRSPEKRGLGHHRNESKTSLPLYDPTLPPPAHNSMRPQTASKDQYSPIKSSLSSRFKNSFDPDTGAWSADTSGDEYELPDGKALHRHAKSVTFDAAPPQVNEYEMATPDLSSIGSNSREGSYDSIEDDDEDDMEHYMARDVDDHDDSFDASLEDTAKTPVVGPDDWKQDGRNDRFERSPLPEEAPSGGRPQHNRTDSSNSNGDHRPLPPLPGMGLTRSHSTSSNGLSATAERMLGAHRSLPSPPPASTTKSEIQNIGNGKMTLEERLKLMMLSDDGKSAAEQQRERRMRRAGPRERVDSQTPEREVRSPSANPEEYEEEDTIGDLSGLEEYQLPPRISRESILRRVNGNKALDLESEYNFSSPAGGASPERQLPVYDRDIPIPSTEDSVLEQEEHDEEGSVIINRDHADMEADVYSNPDLGVSSDHDDEDDTESQYSDVDSGKKSKAEAEDEEQISTTPRAASPVQELALTGFSSGQLVEEPTSFFSDVSKGLGLDLGALDLPKLPPPTAPKMADAQAFLQRPFTPEHPQRASLSKPEYDGSGWGQPDDEYDDEEDEDDDEPGTPESVIHHPVPEEEVDEMDEAEEEDCESPAIPDQVATIKSASGSKLKTRPSATPSDLMAMREARRHVSREIPDIPPIPERHRNRLSRDMEGENPLVTGDEFLERHPSFKNRSLTLDLDLGLSLDQDFERVIEAQKVNSQSFPSDPSATPSSISAAGQASSSTNMAREEPNHADIIHANISSRKQRGYLMRQNTKLVAASDKVSEDRFARSAGNSPVKQERPQSWTVEPWNGQMRKRSIKKQRPVTTGPVPPLPGHESNAAALNPLAEEEAAVEMAVDESGERGRLFVKVMGVKDLDLPIPKSKATDPVYMPSRPTRTFMLTDFSDERTWFSLTLDNGVHCVTTAWLELARNAPIGQEFELVVPSDLEFQLTLNVKLEKPEPKKVVLSPTKITRPKTSTFSRVFASPKKRKEMELRAKEEEERLAKQHRDAQARQMNAHPTAWDLLSPLTAEDGSFARAYICLKEHETKCFGRPYLTDVATFNEWATEEAGFASSVKSKRGNTAVVRRAPYKIGKLELQLLFVPRPKGTTEEDMPKSMNSCIREMKVAEERLSQNWEGHLSQQGGDCPVSHSMGLSPSRSMCPFC